MKNIFRFQCIFILMLVLFFVPSVVLAKSVYVVPGDFFGVAEIGSDVWICGANGTIFHSNNGKTWEVQTSGVDYNLTSLCFINKLKGFCVGYHGTLLRTDDGGVNWAKVPVDSGYYLNAVFFVNDSKGFIVGEFGTLLATIDGGNTWKRVPYSKEPVDAIFNDIGFSGADYGWIVGEFGKVLRTVDGGKNWKEVNLGFGEYMLFAVSVIDKSRVIITGADGLVCRTEDGGKVWKKVDLGVKNQIFGVKFTSAQTGYVFGKNVIFKTEDGGKSFNRVDVGKELTYGWIYRMSQSVAVSNNGTVYRLNNNNWSVNKIGGITQVAGGKK